MPRIAEEERGALGSQPEGLPTTETPRTSPSGFKRARLQRVLEVVVSLIFLALALREISFRELWAALKTAQWGWLIPCVLVTVALLILKGWRWQLLFLPEHRLPFKPVFAALCAGYLASNVFPARAGELVRLVLLVSDQPVSAARTLSSIVVERLLDVLTLLALMVVLLPFVALPEWMRTSAQLLGVAALVASGVVVLLSFWKARLLTLAHAVLGRVRFLDKPGVYAAIGHLIDGFATLRGRLGLGLIGISFFAWLAVVLEAWTAAVAVRLDAPITVITLAVVVTSLGMVVPSSPGYIGIFHYLVTVALVPFGISKEMALTFALVWHAANYLTLSGAGVLALWAHGTSLGQVLARWRNREVPIES